jgi:hypothetical protein
MQTARFLAGIDEAGLGPLLGPFALGYAGLWCGAGGAAGEGAGRWPFEALARVVAEEPRLDRDKLIVTDSKKVHARNLRGRRRLERTVLCFWSFARSESPVGLSARDWLDSPLGPGPELLAAHPWALDLPARLPLWCEDGAIEDGAAALSKEARRAGIEPGPIGVRLVPEAELNAAFDRTENKSEALWEHTKAALALLFEAGERGPAHALPRDDAAGRWPADFMIDRQGGRARYGPALARALQGAEVRLIAETEGCSSYGARSHGPGLDAQVVFAEGGETRSFATALASCFAKYARELAMEGFNRHFGRLAPGLAPTAGYTEDGRRWLLDAERLLPPGALDRGLLVRRR